MGRCEVEERLIGLLLFEEGGLEDALKRLCALGEERVLIVLVHFELEVA